MNRISVLALTAVFLALPASAATPGITGGTFNLEASPAYISQPDGNMVYSWGYGCATPPSGYLGVTAGANCPTMQIPGPTIIVRQDDVITINLTNNLPAAAGNTSILFPGLTVQGTSGGVNGLLTKEAKHGTTVTYTVKADKPGTHTYYSGTQGDLQIEMGLFGAIVVLPKVSDVPENCRAINGSRTAPNGETDFRLEAAAYPNASTCYDREYLFQFSEMDPAIHHQAEVQKDRVCPPLPPNTVDNGKSCMTVKTENYHPAYYMINGRSMPDDMDPNYAIQYPHQPYNGNPHMHPGELVLLRITGQGRLQHPFHEHGNHVRLLARDGNLLVSEGDSTKLAGPLLFTTTTTPGQAMDGIFYWTGKGLNWDVYGHMPGDGNDCVPDANGYYTTASGADPLTTPNYYEWCADHDKPLEAAPAGTVGSGGPVTLPDANILAAGPWYGGSAYLGPDATARAAGLTPISPSGTVANDPGSEAGFAFMWHSHNEREITTNNVFPGGMLMMMLVDPQGFNINETK